MKLYYIGICLFILPFGIVKPSHKIFLTDHLKTRRQWNTLWRILSFLSDCLVITLSTLSINCELIIGSSILMNANIASQCVNITKVDYFI